MLLKIGPGENTIWRRPVVGVFLNDVGAGDVGRHQVGRELDARELQLEHLGQRLDQQRLRQAGDADDQTVAADKQRLQDQLHHVVLTDDAFVQLREDLLAPDVHLVGERNVVGRFEIFFHVGHDALPYFFWSFFCSKSRIARVLERQIGQQLFELVVVLRRIHAVLAQSQFGDLTLERVALLEQRAQRRVGRLRRRRSRPLAARETASPPACPDCCRRASRAR